MKIHWAALGALLFLMGCSDSRTLPSSFIRALTGSDRVEVITPPQTIIQIKNAKKVRKVATFVQAYAKGWKQSTEETPDMEVLFRFYKGEHLLGHFALGQGVIAEGEALVWSQPLTDQAYTELLSLLSLTG